MRKIAYHHPMRDLYYQAFAARDARFDGVFFVGVTSTGIFCRPVCRARTAKLENCRFFPSAAAARKDGFRACKRCRPELAPGAAPIDDAHRIAHMIAARIEDRQIADGTSLASIAESFELSPRQIRRILQQELGVSAIALIQARRLHIAERLLKETDQPITEIAFASGFGSLRRFNDAVRQHYKMPPTHLRQKARDN